MKLTSKLLYKKFKTKKQNQTPPTSRKANILDFWLTGKKLFFTIYRHNRNKNQSIPKLLNDIVYVVVKY